MTNPGGPYVKVHFRLEIEDDWPPASVESLRAIDQGDGTVQLDNIPLVHPRHRLRRRRGHGARRGRRAMGRRAARQSVINAFQQLGVDGEGIERFGMVALDVPPTADLAKVQRLLNHGVAEEWWDMEEGWEACSVPSATLSRLRSRGSAPRRVAAGRLVGFSRSAPRRAYRPCRGCPSDRPFRRPACTEKG
ncbi:DUF4265 domain-containing protein [Streptomyces sp. CA-142005]|uniref:DUF4265 domain-containing protein n=1 Tax=Streptomyces sp. CA-142005 TaxID=3240052 RepID=UPI003D9225BB